MALWPAEQGVLLLRPQADPPLAEGGEVEDRESVRLRGRVAWEEAVDPGRVGVGLCPLHHRAGGL